MNAHGILQAAAGHMRDRAATYDKPEGERSMGATVAAFRAVTGISMNEEQGYVFSAIAFSNGIDFKDRRGSSNKSEKGRASQARYFSRNREVCLERSAMRRLKNPESGRAAVRNRRARIREAKGSHSPSDIARLGVEQGWACAACDADIRESYHVDHVVAVAAGGDNGPDNLQLLCPGCNIRKSTKPLSVFLSEMWPSLFSASFEDFYHA